MTTSEDSSSTSSESMTNVAQLTAHIQAASSCSIEATGGLYLVSEVGEQIAWLVATLRRPPYGDYAMACTPRVEDLQVRTLSKEIEGSIVVGSCDLFFDVEKRETRDLTPGFCWGRLFYNPLLVCGYPILGRSQPGTGLEIDLGHMTAIIGSCQIVQWDQRIIMKGFNMLMIATLVAADVIVWHLLVNEKGGERISFVDSRLDEIPTDVLASHSLRTLETKRHVIGWCSKVRDRCGKSSTSPCILIISETNG